MAPMEEMQIAMELEFLTDASVITPQTLSELLSKIPEQTALHAPISVGAVPSSNAQMGQLQQPPTAPLAAMNLNQQNGQSERLDEKGESYYQPQPSPGPPSYNATPAPSWPPLCQATALYAYTASDKGDLELAPNDHINVTEYLNAEWWKGRSTRTGQEGIFPRSYVKVVEAPAPSNYGNVPMDVAQGSQSGQGGQAPSKTNEMGKKFGKKQVPTIAVEDKQLTLL
ncbi:hypothetical protein AMS68_006651 [Peltaster fructicola]|uniref:SH3 domain-containing protein n=1 Tax=Peltaster fructicola TaxID=286661 RepID=A0A6H0Y295_9PEZI|nr:hypothetical protein AMS68_006651 [Peltaster fructicola]